MKHGAPASSSYDLTNVCDPATLFRREKRHASCESGIEPSVTVEEPGNNRFKAVRVPKPS